MRVLGCDPGTVGAIAILDGTDVLLLEDLPTHQIGTSGRKTTRPEIDLHQLHAMIAAHAPYTHAIIEKVGAMPQQGTVSTFRFGYATGAVTGLLVALGAPLTAVAPKDWQRHHGIGPAPDAARQRACMLFPQVAPALARKRDCHRADALLLASFISSTIDRRITAAAA